MTPAFSCYLTCFTRLLDGRHAEDLPEEEEDRLLEQMDTLWFALQDKERGFINRIFLRFHPQKTVPPVLYFAVRMDLPPGRRLAQVIHAADEWGAVHGPQRGTVIVYAVPNERALLQAWTSDIVLEEGVLFREPDLNNEATAFATANGPLKLSLLP
jgi:hypothetical protein